ncbi:4-hydroxybenzoyl-CoA thioesterase [Pandoraea eparura]|jgi:4-hydroxybenzoyl-CoA thioesterase|uniref:4-hydroxybenzoyl-CoA thioesterase n=1 Tax=Pandoraea eparura TaxID=2508291 RepID=A0A5E4XE70_9BURK|nr:acyl-CoA thioesterase [Pandoraea eparura]VVE34729.1 4-hydroxybenzoyl-CoA thioesterase [Pandoraea eparura]
MSEAEVAAHAFVKPLLVRFKHCDPAGIVFYPRYFEMMNDLVEDWCAEGLGLSFGEMHLRNAMGVPTANIECRFSAPSFLGETLQRSLEVSRLGRSSMTLRIRFSGANDETRLQATLVLVWVAKGEGGRPAPIAVPDAQRAAIVRYAAPDSVIEGVS